VPSPPLPSPQGRSSLAAAAIDANCHLALLLQAAKRKRIEEGYGKNKENAEEKERGSTREEREGQTGQTGQKKKKTRFDLVKWASNPSQTHFQIC
jgi:hypothetical protein